MGKQKVSRGFKEVSLLNRNEMFQGPAPKCVGVLRNFERGTMSRYFDGYHGSVLAPKLAKIFQVPQSQILIGFGIENILRTIFDSLHERRDAVLTHDFHYTYYSKYLSFRHIPIHTFRLIEDENQFHFDIDECLEKIQSVKPKVVLITSPNNPTGGTISSKDLKRILSITNKDTLVVLDEAYFGFDNSYDEKAFLSLLKKHDNLMILRSFSKLYALAGLRIAFALCGKEAKKMLRYQDMYLGGSRILEEVALAALDSKRYYQRLTAQIIRERERLIKSVNKFHHFKAFSSKASFVFIKVDVKAKPLLEQRLAKMKFVISKFTSDQFVRATINTKEHTSQFLQTLSGVDESL